MEGLYLRSEVDKMIKVLKSRTRFYVDSGVIPGFVRVEGRGLRNRYSKKEVFILAIANEMSQAGIGLDVTKKMLKFLDNHEKQLLNVDTYNDVSFKPYCCISNKHFFVLDNCFIEPLKSVTCVVNLRIILESIKF